MMSQTDFTVLRVRDGDVEVKCQ